MSRRASRVASLIRSLVADAIRERLADPRIATVTSVTRVQMSDDLSIAHVNVSVLGETSQREGCLQALRSGAGRLRSYVAERIELRLAPRLQFHLDDSLRISAATVDELDRLVGSTDAAGPLEPAEES